jgi:hypothetical protein
MILILVQMVGRTYVQGKNTPCFTHTLVILLIPLMVILMHKSFVKNTTYLQLISAREIINYKICSCAYSSRQNNTCNKIKLQKKTFNNKK